MDPKFKRNLLAALVAGMLLPVAAQATEADLIKRIEALAAQNAALAQQLEALKGQVQATAKKVEQAPAASTATADAIESLKSDVSLLQNKSLGKWLTVSGDYRFRYDYLEGQTKTFTDVAGTFANAQNALQASFFADPTGPTAAPGMNAAMLTGLMGFAQGMNQVQTYDQAPWVILPRRSPPTSPRTTACTPTAST